MNKKPKVSIIILNYNGAELTSNCLDSIYKQDYKNFEIIIVDNGSTESTDKITKNFPGIKLIKSKVNLGYAEGNNLGFKRSKGELILFLNNDTIVSKNFLKILVNKITSNYLIAAVQPKILCYPKTEIIDSVGSDLLNSGFLYHFGHNKKESQKYNKEKEIFSMKGACMLFKKDILETVGVFDKSYFAYFEETDLCNRVWLAGYRILYVPQAKIYHLGGGTARNIPNTFIQYHSYKNRIYTYFKNFELLTLIKIIPFHILICEFASFVYLFKLKFSFFLAIQKAIFWNIVNFKGIINERKKIKSLRKVSDKKFLPNLSAKVRPSYYYHLFTTSLAGYKD